MVDNNSTTITALEELFNHIPCVTLDEGTFKYIQIEAVNKSSSKKVTFIRGYTRCEYHADILDEFTTEFNQKASKIKIKGSDGKSVDATSIVSLGCPGGGRIKHTADDKKIFIYGYSKGFGRPSHNLTKQLIVKAYPGYSADNITWSNEGY